MKKALYFSTAILIAVCMSSCNKSEQAKPLYDNSKSFVTWQISPLTSANAGETSQSPPLITGWSFDQQYSACRMSLNSLTGPYYGYPTGAFVPGGQLGFDYSNGNNCSQSISLFFNSEQPITAAGNYNAASSFCNGYMAKIAENNNGKDLYFSSNRKQTITIDEYSAGLRMCDNSPVTLLKGRFQLYVTDSIGGNNLYQVSGSFQFPVTDPN
jgi:hypothetical protein